MAEVDDSDICQLCKKAWLTHQDVKKLSNFFQLNEISNSPINRRFINDADEIADILESKDETGQERDMNDSNHSILKTLHILRETLLICEGCEGSFHVLCVGK